MTNIRPTTEKLSNIKNKIATFLGKNSFSRNPEKYVPAPISDNQSMSQHLMRAQERNRRPSNRGNGRGRGRRHMPYWLQPWGWVIVNNYYNKIVSGKLRIRLRLRNFQSNCSDHACKIQDFICIYLETSSLFIVHCLYCREKNEY